MRMILIYISDFSGITASAFTIPLYTTVLLYTTVHNYSTILHFILHFILHYVLYIFFGS